MARAHNFNAGPAVLPVSVLLELQASILEYGDTGMGIMENSTSACDSWGKRSDIARINSALVIP